ncbi:MAG TPA: DUF4184 family protein [Candidatus Limnocylindrales bacterium]|nr:DUF4184 family protein [Candidatus Limnocylindrales bacterium]
MPATFPAHAAAVLPLKFWRPAWFDGVALVVGSMAPDLAYALDGSRLERPSRAMPPLWEVAHSLPWFLAWALPSTVVLCPLIRLSVPVLATHLPFAFHPRASLPGFTFRLLAALRGYAFFGRSPRWYITAFSAAIGALSHVLWDRIALGPLDLASSLLGGIVGLWLLIRFARRLLPTLPLLAPLASSPVTTLSPAMHTVVGSDPPALCDDSRTVAAQAQRAHARRAGFYWATVTAVLAVGTGFLPFLPGYFLPHTTSARVILLALAAVLIAAAVTRSRSLRGEPPQQ